MGSGISASADHRFEDGEGTTGQMLASVALALSLELGLGRFSKLLDAIADNETFHELTMID